jgi:hypothetical protein
MNFRHFLYHRDDRLDAPNGFKMLGEYGFAALPVCANKGRAVMHFDYFDNASTPYPANGTRSIWKRLLPRFGRIIKSRTNPSPICPRLAGAPFT